jgi:predicted PurR-regulated permease PerM
VRLRRAAVGGWPIAAAVAVAAVMLYAVRDALLPFVFAIAIAFVVEPLVVGLQKRIACRRWVAAVAVYLLVAGILVAVAGSVAVILASDAVGLAQQGAAVATELLSRLLGPDGIAVFGRVYTPRQLVADAEAAIRNALGLGAVTRLTGIGVAALFGLFLLLVLTLYVMVSGPTLAAGAIWLIPPERRRAVERLVPRIVPVLRRYLSGICAVVAYTALMGWIGFGLVFHLPHAPLLALVVGLLELVPVIGPVAAATLAGVAVFAQGGGISWFAGAIAFIIALRLSIDNLVGPLVLGRAARVHPVVVIFAFACGAMLFGAIGLLLAVPAAVVLKTALQHYYAEPIVELDAG